MATILLFILGFWVALFFGTMLFALVAEGLVSLKQWAARTFTVANARAEWEAFKAVLNGEAR